MYRLLLSGAAIALLATPVLAREVHHHHYSRYHHQYSPRVGQAYGYMRGRDPYSVYVNGHYAGRDPDPNVRQELENEYYYLHRPFY